MSVKTERANTIESGSPLGKHSLNQRKIGNAIRMAEKTFGGSNKKILRSERRKRKQADERAIEIPTTEKGTKITITIVDFTDTGGVDTVKAA